MSAITNSILNPGGSGPVGDLLECTLSDLECFQLALGECPLFDEGCEQGRLDQLPLDLGHVVNGVHETVESLLAGEDCSDLGTVPEPGTMLLLATGILGLLAIRNKKGRQPAPVTSRSSSSRRT